MNGIRVMKFINWHTATIKSVDPTALVTVGAWNIHSLTDNYSDARESLNYFIMPHKTTICSPKNNKFYQSR